MSAEELREKVDRLPRQPGVYQFRDQNGGILYVGKAKRLRTRVQSYFRNLEAKEGRLKLMISKIADVDVVVTDTEAEALILENTLIKKLQPRYNIMYRDDKSYPYICLTRDGRPRVYPTRTVVRDGSKYFGPYDHAGHMRRMLETIRKAFRLCTCAVSARTVNPNRGAPRWRSCFEAYLGNCSAEMDEEKYREVMSQVERLLAGRTDELIRELKEEMEIASSALEFEEAARLRDATESLVKYNRKMKVVADRQVHRDLFTLSVDREFGEACGVLFKIREGKLIGKFHRFLKNIEGLEPGEMMQSFLEDYYTEQAASTIPDEVYVSEDLPDSEPLLAYLWEERGVKVPIHRPRIGEKKQLVEMAVSNAEWLLKERILEREKTNRARIPQALKDLKEYLRLTRLPRRIECFDNSNLQGSDPVASMVVFVDAHPRKSLYKKFHIRTVTGSDDFASMREVVLRRYNRLVKEGNQLPDLILVDGGKGQLNAAMDAIREAGIEDDCDVAGLSKRLEEVWRPGLADPVMISKRSPSLKLLQQARDEAHRFAVSFHKKTRSGRMLKSELTEIKGVGEKTATLLMRNFGSVKKVASATEEELFEAVGKVTGENIFRYFQQRGKGTG